MKDESVFYFSNDKIYEFKVEIDVITLNKILFDLNSINTNYEIIGTNEFNESKYFSEASSTFKKLNKDGGYLVPQKKYNTLFYLLNDIYNESDEEFAIITPTNLTSILKIYSYFSKQTYEALLFVSKTTIDIVIQLIKYLFDKIKITVENIYYDKSQIANKNYEVYSISENKILNKKIKRYNYYYL